MISEIGLAQRQLLDDETSYSCGEQQLNSDTALGEPLQYGGLSFDDRNFCQDMTHQLTGAFVPDSEDSKSTDSPGVQTSSREQRNEAVDGAYVDEANFNEHQSYSFDQTASHDLNNESPTEYNYFESSLGNFSHAEQSTSALQLNDNEQSSDLLRTPVRSKSMQMLSCSPHDTEPMSSLVSPNFNRSKSDNAPRSSSDQYKEQSLSQSSVHDGLSVPLSIEIPVMTESLDCKGEQEMMVDEGNEPVLSDMVSQEAKQHAEPVEAEAVVDTGAPDAATFEEALPQAPNSNIPEEVDQEDELALPAKASQDAKGPEIPQEVATVIGTDVPNLAIQEIKSPQMPSSTVPKEDTAKALMPPPPPRPEIHFAEPAKPKPKSREPKKKKLKRGKTTSITLKKTYDSDIEDDVIWIDERAVHSDANRTGGVDDYSSSYKPSMDEISLPRLAPGPTVSQDEQAPSESMKRGRKRKKTSEQQAQVGITNSDSPHPPVQYNKGVWDQCVQPEDAGSFSCNAQQKDHTLNDTNEVSYCNSHSQNQAKDPGAHTTYSITENTTREPMMHPQQEQTCTPNPAVFQKPAPATPSHNSTEPTTANNPGALKEKPQVRQYEYPEKPRYQPENQQGTDTNTKKEITSDTTSDLPGKNSEKGPDKHSPIAARSRVPFRVGLSRKARIAPLLKSVKR